MKLEALTAAAVAAVDGALPELGDALPEHACAYCGASDVACVVRVRCDRYFFFFFSC